MSASLDVPTFSLRKPVTTENLAALRADIRVALDGGMRAFAIDIDDVGTLDVTAIATLIAILRDARAGGAEMALRAAQPGILATLHITGLDKVFTVAAPLGATDSAPAASRPRVTRRLSAAFAGGKR